MSLGNLKNSPDLATKSLNRQHCVQLVAEVTLAKRLASFYQLDGVTYLLQQQVGHKLTSVNINIDIAWMPVLFEFLNDDYDDMMFAMDPAADVKQTGDCDEYSWRHV